MPSALRQLVPDLWVNTPLREAKFPDGDVPLLLVAHEIVRIISRDGYGRLTLLSSDRSHAYAETSTVASDALDVAVQIVRRTPELVSSIGRGSDSEVIETLQRATLHDFYSSFKNQPSSYLIFVSALSDHLECISGSGGGPIENWHEECDRNSPSAEGSSIGWDPGLLKSRRLVGPDRKKMPDFEPEPLLSESVRAALTEMSVDRWNDLLSEQPTKLRNLLFRSFGGEESLRGALISAGRFDLSSLAGFGPRAQAQLDAFISSIPVTDTGDPEVSESRESVDSDSRASALSCVVAPPDWADVILGSDPRFEDLTAGVDLVARLSKISPRARRELVGQIEERMSLIRSLTIEHEGHILVAAAAGLQSDHERVAAIAMRFGLNGEDPSTMAVVASKLGVSRARVGQISQRIGARLPAGRVWAPQVDQLEQIIESVVPCSLVDLNDALNGAGLSRIRWTVAALRAVAELTGRMLTIEEFDGYVLHRDQIATARKIVATAQRISDRNGVVSVEQILIETTELGDIDEAFVRDLLMCSTDAVWVDRDWLWMRHGARRNRLVNTSLRILTVHDPQTLESMLEGVVRNYTWRNSTGGSSRSVELQVPPQGVLRSFYSCHPSFSVDDKGLIASRDVLDEETLGPEKLTLVGVLRAQEWPAMTRNDLLAACSSEGMNTATVSIFLTYAECIQNFGRNVWGLRGTRVPEEVVEALQRDARARSRAIDREWHDGVTAAGRPWFTQRITPGMLYSGVVIVPRWSGNLHEDAALAILDGVDGQKVGRLRRSGSFLYGLGGVIRRNEPSVGDFCRITLYADDGYAVVEIGDRELTETPADWT